MTHPYASAAYANVFEDVGHPLWTPGWETYVLARETSDGGRDATGLYPLAVFARDANLESGLDCLREQGLVAVALVPDPATAPPLAELQKAFGLCSPFKTHLLVDYRKGVQFSKHHRYEIKTALRQVSVEVVRLSDHLDAWIRLYAELAARHAIRGLANLSTRAFARLADVEGLTAVGAFADGELVSMHLWVSDPASGAGYSLLAASSAEGYRRSAAYAVYDASIAHFSHLETLNLGGGAGLSVESDGLIRFKQGFANATAQSYFCGAILDTERYAALSGGEAAYTTPFPAYRFAKTTPGERDGPG